MRVSVDKSTNRRSACAEMEYAAVNGFRRRIATNISDNRLQRTKVDRFGIVDKNKAIELRDVVDLLIVGMMRRGERVRVPYASVIDNVIVQKQRAAAIQFAHGKQHHERHEALFYV